MRVTVKKMKYCSKCGNELLDEAVICPKCGCPAANEPKQETKEEINKKCQKALLTGHLLNIFSAVIPLVAVFGFWRIADSYTEVGGGGDTLVTINSGTSLSVNGIVYAAIIGLVIFILGLAIYLLKKSPKTKLRLAYIYLVAAVLDLILFFFSYMLYILSTCGLGIVCLIPGLLQVVAGMKFVNGCKNYVE